MGRRFFQREENVVRLMVSPACGPTGDFGVEYFKLRKDNSIEPRTPDSSGKCGWLLDRHTLAEVSALR